MRLRLVILLSLILFSLRSALYGQSETPDTSRSNYALLWEISGNGLAEPSYVFGSMHVRFGSVFEFPDSLLICLQAADAIANEVHLDSAMQRVLEVYLGGEELSVDSSYIRFISEKIYVPDSTRTVQVKDEQTRSFRGMLREMSEGRDLREGTMMPTMLDAYLMETARRLGKKQYGLERIDEHFYESEENFGRSDRMKFSWFGNSGDDLLRLYYAGELDPIEELIAEDPSEFNQLALIARNYIMVESMERIMPTERLFSVVGVAHLPGKEGVIELLRQRGYTLRRVTPTFTAALDTFPLPYGERAWTVRKGHNEVFSYSLPTAFEYEFQDGDLTNYLSFDIGRGLSYLFLTSSLRPYDKDEFDLNFFELDGYEIDAKVPFAHRELEGYRYDLRKPLDDMQYVRGYTFEYDQMLYYLQVAAYEEGTLDSLSDTDIFLDKFRLLKKNRDKWINFTDTLGGFRVRLPDHHLYSSPLTNQDYAFDAADNFRLHQYRAGFEGPPAAVWMQYYDQPMHEEIVDEVTQFENAKARLEADYGIVLPATRKDTLFGFPRWHLKGEFADRGLRLDAQIIVRAHRTYLLSRVDDRRGRITKKFLPSFTLLPAPADYATSPTPLVPDVLSVPLPGEPVYHFTDQRFEINRPAKLRHRLRSIAPATGAHYEATAALLSQLLDVRDSAQFYHEWFVATADEAMLIEQKQIELRDGTLAQEFRYRTPHAQIFRRVIGYRQGRYLLRKSVTGTWAELESAAADAFFFGDDWLTPPSDFPLFTDRTEALLEGLQSADSTLVYAALQGISPGNTFDQDDLPRLRSVFLDNYWETFQLTYSAVNKLLPFILKNGHYGEELLLRIFQSEDLSPTFRSSIVSALIAAPEEAGFPLFFRILEQAEPLSEQVLATSFSFFKYRPDLIIKYWPNFQELLIEARDPLQLWEVTGQALQQDTLDVSPLLASADLFAQRGEERLRGWRTGDDPRIPTIIFNLYQAFPTQAGMSAQARAYHERATIDRLTLEATAYLLAKGKSISVKQQKRMLREVELRTPLLRLLNTYDRLDDVSNKYYDQPTLARDLFLAEMAQVGQLENVELIDEMEVLFQSEARKVYLFSFDLDGEKQRLGVVGFFARDPEDRSFLDDGHVNFTRYTVTPRRRARKAEQLVEEMKEVEENTYTFEKESY